MRGSARQGLRGSVRQCASLVRQCAAGARQCASVRVTSQGRGNLQRLTIQGSQVKHGPLSIDFL